MTLMPVCSHLPWIILGTNAGLELHAVPCDVLRQFVDDGLDVRWGGDDRSCLGGNFQFGAAVGEKRGVRVQPVTDHLLVYSHMTPYLASGATPGAAEGAT